MTERVYGSTNRILPWSRPTLQPTSDYLGCVCGTRFQSSTRRRNCYMCGEIYCMECTRKSVPLPQLNYTDPVTVCDTCYLLQQMASMPKQELKKLPIKWLLFYVHAFNISIEGDVEKETIIEKIEKSPITENMMRTYSRYPSYYDSRRNAFLPKPARKREARATTSRRSSMEQEDGFFGFFLNPFELFNQGLEWATDTFGSMGVEETRPRSERAGHHHHQPQPQQQQQQRMRPEPSRPETPSPPTRPSSSRQATPSSDSIPPKVPQRPLTIEELVKRKTNLQELSVGMLKSILNYNAVEHRNLVEKSDLIALVRRLCDEYQRNNERIVRGESPKDADICKICFDQPINCVFLECGHMASCIECARQLFECPICRESILRIVHTFRA